MEDGSFILKEESILKSIMHVLPNNNEWNSKPSYPTLFVSSYFEPIEISMAEIKWLVCCRVRFYVSKGCILTNNQYLGHIHIIIYCGTFITPYHAQGKKFGVSLQPIVQ